MDNQSFIYIIKIIHIALISFVILCPFVTDNKQLIQINITLLFYFLFKWIINDENARCGLTELEYQISGKPYNQGFIYKIIIHSYQFFVIFCSICNRPCTCNSY